jgi:hypothetical protein
MQKKQNAQKGKRAAAPVKKPAKRVRPGKPRVREM